MEACTIAQLKKGERGIISSFDVDKIPLKLIELGCFVGSEVEVLQKATLGDPIYIRMNEAYLSSAYYRPTRYLSPKCQL